MGVRAIVILRAITREDEVHARNLVVVAELGIAGGRVSSLAADLDLSAVGSLASVSRNCAWTVGCPD
jgi:hypothetical protein